MTRPRSEPDSEGAPVSGTDEGGTEAVPAGGLRGRLAAFQRRHLPKGSIRESLVSGAFWSVTGSVFSRAFVLGGGIAIARMVGKAGYGQWGLVVATVQMFAQYAAFGLAVTATKHVAELRHSDPVRAGRVLSLVMVLGLILLTVTAAACAGSAYWLAHGLYNVPDLFVPLVIASVLLFSMVGTLMIQGALAGFEDFRGIARVNFLQGLAFLLATIPLTWWLGLSGAVVAMSVSYVLALVLSLQATFHWCRGHGIPLGTRGIWRERLIIWQYGIPSLLGGSVSGPAATFSKAIVARVPQGLAGLGGVEAALKWQMAVLFVPEAVRRVTLPMLSRLSGAKDGRRYVKALWANIVLNGGVALLAALPVMILSPWILGLYGRDFRQDWDIMVVLVGAGVFQAVKNVLSQVTASLEKLWWNFGLALIWAAVTLGGTALMVPRYGVRGYVWTVAFAAVLNMLMYALASAIIVKHRGVFQTMASAQGTEGK